MKHFVSLLVLCYAITLASSQSPYVHVLKRVLVNGGAGGGQPLANEGAQDPTYNYGGGQQPNYNYGGQQPQQGNYGGCEQTACASFCTIGTGPDGCPECICIQN
ncbi:hypothetical protein AVEN_157937-4 [Araneus ventricosus]|uniref:Uncharacterized protein n=1 Tax=Araneus ventricosus TaxID=182803 RepID=A0A4Y2HAK3_ARAVE|nr:hypothetical protein AVEN_157937-4 [Araneus ventricosus]